MGLRERLSGFRAVWDNCIRGAFIAEEEEPKGGHIVRPLIF